jgi:hypothetical protein
VRAGLDDPPAVEHDDLVRVADGRQPVRDRDRRPARGELLERCLHQALGLRVEGRGRLVEDEHRRVTENRAGDRDPLLLAAGEAVASLAHDRVVALRQRCDQLVDLRGTGGCLDLLVGGIGLGEAEVLAHRGMEEVGLLRDDPDGRGERLEREVAHVDAIDRDAAPRRVVQARDQVGARRLSGSRLPDERGLRARRDGERDVLERPGRVVVAEPHAVEPHLAARRGEPAGSLDHVHRLVQVLEDPVEQRE